MYSMGPPKWSHAWTCSQELGIPRNIGLAECSAAKKNIHLHKRRRHRYSVYLVIIKFREDVKNKRMFFIYFLN